MGYMFPYEYQDIEDIEGMQRLAVVDHYIIKPWNIDPKMDPHAEGLQTEPMQRWINC